MEELAEKNELPEEADLPIIISWYDAVEFCNRLSLKEGLEPVYVITERDKNTLRASKQEYKFTVTWNKEANGYRLPTSQEWECACRAGTMTVFNTGESISTDQANYDGKLPVYNSEKGLYRKKNYLLEVLLQMHGVYMICMGMYTNGVGIGGRITKILEKS